jgi:hypothetical protein
MADQLIRTIKAISMKEIGNGKIGFLTEEEIKWYNVLNEPKILQGLLDTIIQKGNLIQFEDNAVILGNFVIKEKAKNEKFDKSNGTEDMMTFEELLRIGHEQGIIRIQTKMIQINEEKKSAIFKAQIKMKNESIYEAYGDANQENCGSMVKMHYIRMAETRAIARALRWATNNAAVIEETENK